MLHRFVLGLVCLCMALSLSSQTELEGIITDKETKDPLIGATIILKQNNEQVLGIVTNFDGTYNTELAPGTYDLEISYLGYSPLKIEGFVVYVNRLNRYNVELESGAMDIDPVVVTHTKEIIEPDQITPGITLGRKEMERLSNRDIRTIASQAPGVGQADANDPISIKGSRFNAINYYIDDIRVNGAFLIPLSEVEQMQVMTGGIDAQYGDVTGGVIAITTRGPANELRMGLELDNSGWTDAYGYRRGLFNLSTPILKRKVSEDIERTMLGLRMSARYLGQKDDDPAATSVFRIKDDVLADLRQDPILSLGASNRSAAERLRQDQVDELNFRPFENSDQVDLTARLDFRPSDRISLILTGTYSRQKDQFTPDNTWVLLNSQNNPSSLSNVYRANFSFKHRLTEPKYLNGKGQQEFRAIDDISYTLQGGYEKSTFSVSDPRHGDRLFDYGYIGSFDYEWVPTFDRQSGQHDDYRREFRGYQGGNVNPVLVNYNEGTDIANANDLVSFNGFSVGNVSQVWGLHTNLGTVYDRFGKRDNDRYTFNAMASLSWRPSKKIKSRHTIRFGFQYEQRVNRGYEVTPVGIWNVARQQANRHILGLDTLDVIGELDGAPIYNTFITNPEDLYFYQNVRDIAFPGLSDEDALHRYVNVDALNPGDLSIGLFSPQELTDQNVVNYWGYDYLGNKANEKVTFNDFFTARDANGVRSFPVAADRPVYTAIFLQDRFSINKMIFKIGVRVDRFDANSKVLRDPYSLYEIKTADQFYAESGEVRPGGVEDDFKVYLSAENTTDVVGFRKGDQWYGANGQPVNDGNVIFGGGVVTPALVNPEDDIRSRDFDPDRSFVDYEPQVNIMPRLGFSFPISKNANFFAHYDVLTQRPTNNRVSALEYFYFNERTPANNPNLKPSKTIEYEVGFQQKVGEYAGLKLTAYYRELRDMIQRRTYLYIPAPVSDYETYDNQDFGTIKGFTAQYIHRDPNGVSIDAVYTLQFAEGTGSNSETRRGISNQGILRTIYPLDFDVRHRLVGTINFNFGTDKIYRGPIIFGQKILKQSNINLQLIANSGSPYTQNAQPDRFGGSSTVGAINGGRVSWTTTLNLTFNKRFSVKVGEKKMAFNVNARISNLLDRRNIVRVYTATGSPTDDGYLRSVQGQSELSDFARSGLDVNAFASSYQWRLLNPDFFSQPRTIILGMSWEF